MRWDLCLDGVRGAGGGGGRATALCTIQHPGEHCLDGKKYVFARSELWTGQRRCGSAPPVCTGGTWPGKSRLGNWESLAKVSVLRSGVTFGMWKPSKTVSFTVSLGTLKGMMLLFLCTSWMTALV